MVEKSLDAYKQKKKYDRQEELVQELPASEAVAMTAMVIALRRLALDKPIRDKWAVIVA
ncbi:MAG: hypothetical protein R3D26_11585 [Cyanobacteriota/Melainabacteria group bacterium]